MRDASSGSDQPLPGATTMAEAQYQHNVAVSAAGVRGSRGPFRVDRRCDVGQPEQARKPKTLTARATVSGARGKDGCYGKTKHTRKNCHSFTMALLITPSGIRIPFCKPYHTREYCKETGREHRTTAEAAADLIRELPLPEGAKVLVLGDTAYDAEVVRDACRDRGYSWIFPCNPERVLAGPKGQRPKVRSLLKDWSKWSRQTVRLAPGQGAYAVYRRLSPHLIGPKAKVRTFYVHQERQHVHSIGEVRLVFSTMEQNLKTATPDDVKILMTNDMRLSVREVVEAYSVRWQIELFFKELKSTLGFHQYQFQEFAPVEGWVDLSRSRLCTWSGTGRSRCHAAT